VTINLAKTNIPNPKTNFMQLNHKAFSKVKDNNHLLLYQQPFKEEKKPCNTKSTTYHSLQPP